MNGSVGETGSLAGPRFAAGLSRTGNTNDAVREACEQVLSTGGSAPSLAFAFLSRHHGAKSAAIAGAICDRLKTDALVGCMAESIVGGELEIEDGPALAVWAAWLPGAQVEVMHLEYARSADGGSFVGWPDALLEAWPENATLLLLGEPFSFPTDVLLEQVSDEHPGANVIGGMAGGGHGPGENRLLFRRGDARQGAVAVLLDGAAVRVRPVVSQGCRPIGKPMVITKAERNVVQELGGRAPLAILKELYATLGPEDQRMMQSGLHLGRVTNEYREAFQRGDFLVRNVIGVDGESGAIAIGDYLRVGQTVQFHLRDAASADEDLRELLAAVTSSGGARGALLFTCNGRGTRLFDGPNHDAAAVRAALGPIPVAGFFAQGEIGPVGGRNFLHGFTASLAVFDGAE